MNSTFVIAKNTFRETLRDRILYGIVGFGIAYILCVLFLAKLALGDLVMIKSFGLAGIYLFGLVITIFLGASLIYKEIERRTLYFVLSKPVRRSNIIIGKFFGLLAAVTVTIALMTVFYLCVIAYEGGGFDLRGLLAILFQIMEMSVFIALLTLISTVAAPLTSTICAMMLLFAGHLLNTVILNAHRIGGVAYRFIQVLYYLLPNLEKFNVRGVVVHAVPLSASSALLTLGYAVAYDIFLLFLATLLFRRKEL